MPDVFSRLYISFCGSWSSTESFPMQYVTNSNVFLSIYHLFNFLCPENKYVIAIFNYKFEFIKVRTSTFRTLAISFNCATEGWDLLWHHREMVCSVLPSFSASQRLVFSCSARTTRIRFNVPVFSLFAINCSIIDGKFTRKNWDKRKI